MREQLIAMILLVSKEIGATQDIHELQNLYIEANGLFARLGQYPAPTVA